MTIRVAINGFGRIGRNVLRAHYEYAKQHDVEIVAINSPGDLAVNAHLLKYDTVHGRFATPVETDGKDMIVGGDRIHVFKTRDPRELPWADLGVDLVMECTGAFNSKEASMVHIESGAKKVLLSAPGKTADATVVYGVNQDVLKATDLVVSNASCTTNGLAPLVKPLQDKIGIEHGSFVHERSGAHRRLPQGSAPSPRCDALDDPDEDGCCQGRGAGAAAAEGPSGRLCGPRADD